ncbi:MAG TPA: hypothetical protein VGO50_13420 [Pyrinomonadaceae bacterium]|jgi:hypothetical protein|nr:hypothetical protein [Pyrinomonadaceae bacterium]
MDFEEFEDLDDPFADFGEPSEDTDEYFVTEIRTAVLKKKDLVALLCLKTANRGGAICRVDPREAQPSVQLYDDPEKAVEWYNKSLNTSKENGWQVVYDGLPLRG